MPCLLKTHKQLLSFLPLSDSLPPFLISLASVAVSAQLWGLPRARATSAPLGPASCNTATVQMDKGGANKGQGGKAKGGKGKKGTSWAREVRPATSGVAVVLPAPPPRPPNRVLTRAVRTQSSSNQGVISQLEF